MRRWFLALSLLGVLSPAADALTPEERGLQIAREMDRRDSGWKDQRTRLQMILRNRKGDETSRLLTVKLLEVEGDGDKSLMLFHNPRDVKGTIFLSHTHATRPDDQWLYLPALKRVKRIASANKSGPFVGSEFAYEDMTSQEVERYTYKYLEDANLTGRDTFVIERYPTYKYSGYTRQVVWVDKQMYRPLKVEFHDRKNDVLKTLMLEEYRQYLNQYWRPDRMVMVNHQTGRSTTMHWDDYEFRNGFSERDFERNSLKRIR